MRIPLRRRPLVCLWLPGCLLLAGLLPAPEAAAEVSVTGLELRVDAGEERLRVFADGPLEPRVVELDERTWMVALPGAVLADTAPTRIAPTAQGVVRRVAAFDTPLEAGEVPEVRVVVHRRPGPRPRLERQPRSLTFSFDAPAGAGREPAAASIPLHYRGVPLARFVDDIAKATGETLVYDDSLSGSITVEGPDRVSRAEALALLDSALLLRGYAAVPSPGGVRTIVPVAGASGPWTGDSELAESDAPATTLLRLDSVEADEVATVLRPYLGSSTLALAYAPSNSLILAGSSQRLRRLIAMIEELDAAEPVQTVLWPLYHAEAETVAAQLQEILGEEALPLAASDLRTNSLLLGVRGEDLEKARRAVYRLDRPAIGRSSLHVVPLRHADPETMANHLISLRDGSRVAPFDPVGFATSQGLVGLEGLDFEVVVDSPTHSLVLRAAPPDLADLLDVVRELDRPPVLVRVEVMVARVSLGESLDLGIDYLIPTLANTKKPTDLIASVSSNLGFPGDDSYTASFGRSPITLTVFDPVSGTQVPILNPLTGMPVEIPRERVAITARQRDVDTELLIRPELLVNSGEEHRLFAGDNIPIPIGRAVEGQVATQITQDIQRQDVGVTLQLLPTVGQQGGVVLELRVEVSELGESTAGDVERVGPTLDEISVESLIRLQPGEVAVIATAARPTTAEAHVGVPWLMDVPGLNWLFRRTAERKMKRHLLITAQAEVVSDEMRAMARRLEQIASRQLAEEGRRAQHTR